MKELSLWSDNKSYEDIQEEANKEVEWVLSNLYEDILCLKEDLGNIPKRNPRNEPPKEESWYLCGLQDGSTLPMWYFVDLDLFTDWGTVEGKETEEVLWWSEIYIPEETNETK